MHWKIFRHTQFNKRTKYRKAKEVVARKCEAQYKWVKFISIFFMWQRQISLLLYELSVHPYVIGYTSSCFWSTCSISPENNFVSHLWPTFSLEITSWWSTTGYDGIIINMVSVTVEPVTEVASIFIILKRHFTAGCPLPVYYCQLIIFHARCVDLHQSTFLPTLEKKEEKRRVSSITKWQSSSRNM